MSAFPDTGRSKGWILERLRGCFRPRAVIQADFKAPTLLCEPRPSALSADLRRLSYVINYICTSCEMLIRYTHRFSALINGFSTVLLFLSWIGVVSVLMDTYNWQGLSQLIPAILAVALIIYPWHLWMKLVADPASTYLYCRNVLGAKINWREAKFLSLFFSYGVGEWYPMTHVKELPPETRRDAIFVTVKRILEEKRRKSSDVGAA